MLKIQLCLASCAVTPRCWSFSCPTQLFLVLGRVVAALLCVFILCPAHYTHNPATLAPCQAHSEASGFPAGNTLTRSWLLKCRLNCFVWGGKPCISIKWAFQAKHIHALAAIESGPAVLSVSQGGFYLVYLLNAVKKKTKMKGHISGSVRCETITPDFQRSAWCFHSPANFLIGQFVTRVKLPSTSKIHFG